MQCSVSPFLVQRRISQYTVQACTIGASARHRLRYHNCCTTGSLRRIRRSASSSPRLLRLCRGLRYLLLNMDERTALGIKPIGPSRHGRPPQRTVVGRHLGIQPDCYARAPQIHTKRPSDVERAHSGYVCSGCRLHGRCRRCGPSTGQPTACTEQPDENEDDFGKRVHSSHKRYAEQNQGGIDRQYLFAPQHPGGVDCRGPCSLRAHDGQRKQSHDEPGHQEQPGTQISAHGELR